MKVSKEDIRKRYKEDHVFRSLADVIASHFRLNLGYTKQEVQHAVQAAEEIVTKKKAAQANHPRKEAG